MRKQTIIVRDLNDPPAKVLGDEVERKHLIQGVGLDVVIEEQEQSPEPRVMLYVEQLDGQRVMHQMSVADVEDLIFVYNHSKKRFAEHKNAKAGKGKR